MAGTERATITEEDVRRIAGLAGLPLTDDRVKLVAREMRGMLSLATSLYDLDTREVDPDLAWDARWE